MIYNKRADRSTIEMLPRGQRRDVRVSRME